MYYKQPLIINSPIGNNAFVYDKRKQLFGKAEIFVPALIDGVLDDVQLGDSVVFGEALAGETREFYGLKNLVCLHNNGVSIYVMDNHNHALYCRYREVLAGRVQRGLPVIHIDQHSDMKDPVGWIDPAKEDDLDYIATYVNEVCTIADFIQPALRSGLISDCVQVRTENQLLMVNGEGGMKHYHYILDIDIDFWAPEMGIEEFDRTIEKTRQLIAGASLVTIATSPCFIEQERAVEIVKRLLAISS